LLTIRKEQLKIFEDLTMFEQGILCHKLPNSYNSIMVNNNEEQCINKRRKMVQELKRQMLHTELEEYEIKIQHYEYLYEQEITAFKSETSRINASYQMHHFDMLIHFVKVYLYHHTNILIRQIRYKESCHHVKLIRHHHHRQLLSTTKQIIDIYPQIIVDIPKVSLNRIQLDYLSRNGKLKLLFNSYLYHYILFHFRT
jgi:hypothetical protein